MRLLPLLLLVSVACRTKDETPVDSQIDVGPEDADGDGFSVEDDCDDADPAVNPDAAELCDGVDNDCDGEADEDAADTLSFYEDADGDGYGDERVVVEACEAPEGYVEASGDCDDADAAFYPGAPEEDCADPNDYNCDGSVGYDDADGDGYAACEECDDGERAVNPSAAEVCDGVDNDCDGEVDAGAVDAATWYQDADGDGFGDADFSTESCEAPEGYADNADDCDDAVAEINPAAEELCNDLDDDCDSGVDEAAVDAATWYADIDGDGYGSSAATQVSCDPPSGYAASDGDCDEGDVAINPGATEVCDAQDNDCDGLVDDDDSSLDTSTATTFYSDGDGDGYGDSASTLLACAQPSGAAAVDGDCDDADVNVNPGESEQCDGIDNDCDGSADSGALGAEPDCAASSCNEILLDGSSIGDGAYYLDPTGSGAPTLFTCDMTTDGGGWTQVAYWNRVDDGDDLADLQSHMTQVFDNMTEQLDQSSYVELSDDDGTADVWAYSRAVDVPNSGEVLFAGSADGRSMEDSGVWFYAVAGGADTDLACYGVDDQDCTPSGTASYTNAEYAYVPGYTCANTATGNLSIAEDYQGDLGAEVTEFHILNMMCDLNGDHLYLYNFELWVR